VGGAERQVFQLAARWPRGAPAIVLTRRVAGLSRREVVEGIEIRRVISTLPIGPFFGLSFLATLAGNLVRLADVRRRAGRSSAVGSRRDGFRREPIGKPSIMRIASVGPRRRCGFN